MILSDHTITELVGSGELEISPFDPEALQPASIDLRLGDHFLLVDETHMTAITLNSEIHYREVTSDQITIPPKSFLLATTREYIRLPANLTAFVEGRSSVGRMGLFIQNAGWVDAGFQGRITLELYNANSLPIRLEADRRICQLVLCKMDRPAARPYAGKYQNQTESVGSRIFLDTEASPTATAHQ